MEEELEEMEEDWGFILFYGDLFQRIVKDIQRWLLYRILLSRLVRNFSTLALSLHFLANC